MPSPSPAPPAPAPSSGSHNRTSLPSPSPLAFPTPASLSSLLVPPAQVHHEFTSPIALVAIYCTPLEFVLSDLLPLSIGLVPFRSHIFFAIMWIVAAVIGTQVHHSGYRFPWTFGPDEQPDFHDFHHQKFKCNYGNLGILDALHGTSDMFVEHRARLHAAAREEKAK